MVKKVDKNEALRRRAIISLLTISFSFGGIGLASELNDPLKVVLEKKALGKKADIENLVNNIQSDQVRVAEINKNKPDNLGMIIQTISADARKNNSGKGSVILTVDHNGEDSFRWGDYLNSSLSSRSAIVVKAGTGEVMYQKNPNSRLSLASISKLMAAMVFLDARQDLSSQIMITDEDVDRLKKSSSRLTVGTILTRQELLHIGLMSSENRAIHALARNYPGGVGAFVSAMNAKARRLGMGDTVFYEPTGLDPRNQSTASDIVKMAKAADSYPLIRYYTTDQQTQIIGKSGKMLTYKNSNSLVRDGNWNVGLQKTGYIRESGRCMVVKSRFGNDDVYLVFLGAPSSYSRVSDAEHVKEVFGGRYY